MNNSIDLILSHSISEAQSVANGAEDFTNELFSVLPKNQVYRMPSTTSSRFYFSWVGGELVYGSGLSAFAKHMSNSYFLDKWKQDNGPAADEIMRIAASYGTFVHVVYSVIATDYARGYGFKVNRNLFTALREYMVSLGIPLSLVGDWSSRLSNDVASFTRWLHEWKVEVLACEYPVFDWTLGVSTPIDLVFTYEGKRGERITAAMNYKTRESGSVFQSDEYQIPVEALLLDRNLPDLKVSESFVWIPRNPKRATTDPWIVKDMLKVKHARLSRPYSWDDFVRDWNWQKMYGPNTYSYQIDLDKPIEDMGTFEFIPGQGNVFEEAKTIRQYCESFKPEQDSGSFVI